MIELKRLVVNADGADSVVAIRFCDASDGDFAVASHDVEARRRNLDPRPWTWLDQVHGADVVRVDAAGEHCGVAADASVTTIRGAVLAVQTADCVPVILWSPEGVVGAVHSGWRGAEAGVVEAAVERVRDMGARTIYGVIGPHIRVGAYEFSSGDAAELVRRYGADVLGSTDSGTVGLDTNLVVRRALAAAGARLDTDVGSCTSDPQWWSHRVRRDSARQVATVVLE